MGKGKPAVQAWVALLVIATAAITAAEALSIPVTSEAWVALSLLTFCAALANAFPIKSASDGASYRLNNVFVVAGAIILPTSLLTLLAALAVAPDLWIRRHRPRVLIGWLFNVAQTALAAHVARLWVLGVDSLQLSVVGELASLLGAAALFTVVQAALVGVVIVLDQRIPIYRAPTFTLPALLGDGLICALGSVVAGLWLAKPSLLVLVPVVLIISHRMTRTAHMAHLAEVDSKTGLHNSRHFEQALEEELAHSLRVKRPLALLFADLDHFKRVNDQYGHAAGDVVLRETSKLLTSMVRKGDLVARFGGEEFVVMLPGTDIDEATYLAERIRSTLEQHHFTLEDNRVLRCTISVGVASCPDDATELAKLIEQADVAMYRAKQTRNAVARASSHAPVPRLPLVPPALQPPAPASAAHAAPAFEAPTAARATGTAAAARPADAVPAAPRTRSVLVPVLLWSMVALAAFVSVWCLASVHRLGSWLILLPFLALAVGAELLKVQVYEASRQKVSLSFTAAVTMAAVTVQPLLAPLVDLASSVVHLVLTRQRQVDKVLFNLANPTIAAAAASAVYVLLRPDATGFTFWHLAAALAATLAHHLVNVGVLSIMISLHTRRPLLRVVRESAWFGPTHILVGLTGAFLGSAQAQLGLLGIVMFIVPILVMRFTLTFYARQTQRQIATLQSAKAEVEEAHAEKEEMLRKLIETVALIIDARDNSVSGHSRRVAKFAVAVGKEMGLSASELAVVHTAGLFHDLGKVGIPESILHKPARLTPEEYETIKEHAALGERILSEVPQLADISQMVGEHHERYDGKGYPRQLSGGQISTGGRILVVSDALETMLADRPYSKGRSLEAALAELDRCNGTHFDPEVVGAVHRAVASLGAAFFMGSDAQPARDWGAADQILAQVFA